MTEDGDGEIPRGSAWAVENRLVLGQVKVDEASHEITAIPEAMRSMVAAE